MEFLKKLFKSSNPTFQFHIPEELHNLLLDWFNESKTDIATFDSTFFEPIIEVLRSVDIENQRFEKNPERYKASLYIKFAFLYLIQKHPDEKLLVRLSSLKEHGLNMYHEICKYSPNRSVDKQRPDLFTPLEIGAMLASYFHSIHLKSDQNISYLPGPLTHLKFTDKPELFEQVFNYVAQQKFEEKPFVLFTIYQTRTIKHHYTKDEGGKHVESGREVIGATPFDKQIQQAFSSSLDEHNSKYATNLNIQMLEYLRDFTSCETMDKKTKLTAASFPQAKQFLERIKGNEELALEHIIFYIKNIYLYEQDRYWKFILKAICENLVCSQEWLKEKIDFVLSKDEPRSSVLNNEIRNSHLIINYIITPLFSNLANTLRYEEAIVQNYRELVFSRCADESYEPELTILRTLAKKTIENRGELNLEMTCLDGYFFKDSHFNCSSLNFNEDDKNFTILKKFVSDLNLLIPIALKKVNKNVYGESDAFIILNYNGEDYSITKSNLARDINFILQKASSPYRLVKIPIQLTKRDWNNRQWILFALGFMNEMENQFFYEKHLTIENIQKWYMPSQHSMSFENFVNHVQINEGLRPDYKAFTELPFQELKIQKPEIQIEQNNDNLFLANINWNWFKEKYIDELSSKEQWYDIMHVICQVASGKKPKASWIIELKEQVEKLGSEKYFKELQVLFSISLKEESWFFGDFNQALKGLIWSCAYIEPSDLSLGILKNLTEFCYKKIPGVGAKSAATGNLALEALVATQNDTAFGMLNIMRNKTKYNKFIVALEKSIDKYKENSTIPEQLLADKSIPNFGFTGDSKSYPISDHKIIVRIKEGKFVKSFEDKEGKQLKKLPDHIVEDLKSEIKEINEEIKQITAVFNDLKTRIKTYWLYDRIWNFADYKQCILEHPLIAPHIENLVWTNLTTGEDFIVSKGLMLKITGQSCTPDESDNIRLWHPILNTEGNISAWQNYLWENNIKQAIRQVYRESYPFSKTELSLHETPRFANHFLETNKLMALANSAGWIYTYIHEGYNWPRIFLKPLNITAQLICDYDRFEGLTPTKNLYFTKENTTKISDYTSKSEIEKLQLSSLPIVTLSEICRDIDLFIATTSVASNPELSQNRQKYETYYTEYQKGLFSEDATAKVRRQIVERIAPILKLNVEGFEGNFIIIKGKNDAYRINLSSGFAQTQITHKHINLIPDFKKVKADKKLRLPIEDDDTLYLILAKILFLQTEDF